jgi:hypothetical protein
MTFEEWLAKQPIQAVKLEDFTTSVIELAKRAWEAALANYVTETSEHRPHPVMSEVPSNVLTRLGNVGLEAMTADSECSEELRLAILLNDGTCGAIASWNYEADQFTSDLRQYIAAVREVFG